MILFYTIFSYCCALFNDLFINCPNLLKMTFHLDVYKRQTIYIAVPHLCNFFAGISKFRIGSWNICNTCLIQDIFIIKAVSYTHLDVYKRQVRMTAISIIAVNPEGSNLVAFLSHHYSHRAVLDSCIHG